jgi:hypothetical protein
MTHRCLQGRTGMHTCRVVAVNLIAGRGSARGSGCVGAHRGGVVVASRSTCAWHAGCAGGHARVRRGRLYRSKRLRKCGQRHVSAGKIAVRVEAHWHLQVGVQRRVRQGRCGKRCAARATTGAAGATATHCACVGRRLRRLPLCPPVQKPLALQFIPDPLALFFKVVLRARRTCSRPVLVEKPQRSV